MNKININYAKKIMKDVIKGLNCIHKCNIIC